MTMKTHDYAWLQRFRARMEHDDRPAIVDAIDELLKRLRTQQRWCRSGEEPVVVTMTDFWLH